MVDFFLQPPYMWQNKGTYGHLGGLTHSAFHAVVTMFILGLFYPGFWAIAVLGLLEFIIHYHMDWFKMWYTKLRGFTPETEPFWVWLGIDQFVHSATYLLIAFLIMV